MSVTKFTGNVVKSLHHYCYGICGINLFVLYQASGDSPGIGRKEEISLAGSNININGTATAPPYIVKAIGNPQTLEGAITLRGGIVYTMKMKYNLVVDTEIKENMVIGRYTGVVAFRYAKPVDTETQAVVQK